MLIEETPNKKSGSLVSISSRISPYVSVKCTNYFTASNPPPLISLLGLAF